MHTCSIQGVYVLGLVRIRDPWPGMPWQSVTSPPPTLLVQHYPRHIIYIREAAESDSGYRGAPWGGRNTGLQQLTVNEVEARVVGSWQLDSTCYCTGHQSSAMKIINLQCSAAAQQHRAIICMVSAQMSFAHKCKSWQSCCMIVRWCCDAAERCRLMIFIAGWIGKTIHTTAPIRGANKSYSDLCMVKKLFEYTWGWGCGFTSKV